MRPFVKYTNGLSDDPLRRQALRAFFAAVDGRIGRMTFKMVTDQQMRSVLDDEDFELWLKLKSEHKAVGVA